MSPRRRIYDERTGIYLNQFCQIAHIDKMRPGTNGNWVAIGAESPAGDQSTGFTGEAGDSRNDNYVEPCPLFSALGCPVVVRGIFDVAPISVGDFGVLVVWLAKSVGFAIGKTINFHTRARTSDSESWHVRFLGHRRAFRP